MGKDPERWSRRLVGAVLCATVLGMFAWCLYCWAVLW